MSILILDTETNGFPPKCRVIQLAWQIYSHSGEFHLEDCALVFPDGWEIPNEKFWIENGYSQEGNLQMGKKMGTLLEYLCLHIKQLEVDTIVCHNTGFDVPILVREMQTYGITTGRKLKQVCTMKSATEFCELHGQYGRFKWPNLTELHTKLFGVGFEGAHDALADVKATAKCYFELLRLNIIS